MSAVRVLFVLLTLVAGWLLDDVGVCLDDVDAFDIEWLELEQDVDDEEPVGPDPGRLPTSVVLSSRFPGAGRAGLAACRPASAPCPAPLRYRAPRGPPGER